MNRVLYTKLAWTSIRKNRQVYYPYLLAGTAMVMVFYIFNFLGLSDVVKSLPGREVLPILFEYGSLAIGLFSIPFLFYTNSTLIKKRKTELGLYNILGMNKKNIFMVLFWETLISYGIVTICGIVLGIIFSKVAELGLVNIMDKQVNFQIYVEWKSVLITMLMYAVIYFLILLNALHQIRNNNPIELLHSDSTGERPPKSRWVLAVVSLVFILVAYFIVARAESALLFQDPKVMVAVVLIIIGTFLLFMCASVFLCKALQNNKRYYYKTSHFISVSTMSYRMRRNGASLAAICVLATLILATLAFSVSFYIGSTDAINDHYPYDIGVSVEIPTETMVEEISSGAYTEELRLKLESIVNDYKDAEITELYSANMLALITDGRLDLRSDMRDTWFTPGYYDGWEKGKEKIVYVHVISLDDYNRLCGTAEKLDDNEVLIASETVSYQSNAIVLYNGEEIRVSKTTKQIPEMSEVRIDGASLDTHGCEEMFLVVSDIYFFMGEESGSSVYNDANYLSYTWQYGFNLSGTDEVLQQIYSGIENTVQSLFDTSDSSDDTTCYLKTEKGERFYALAGGLLFLVLIINILFIFMAALIMYYKQISEGYEDQKRFSIMQKIGMTKKEIKKSINSQLLTVFFLPLIVAGFHFAFTSNVVYSLLNYAVVDNKPLLIKVMCICYVVFALVYSLVYIMTSRTYYNIVNRAENE